MISIKLIWTGLFFIIAFGDALQIIGGSSSAVTVGIGSVLFFLGTVLMWFDK